jgi:Cupin
MSRDTLSDVLRAVRLRGAVFYDVEGASPWVAEAPAAREIIPAIMPGVDHMIEDARVVVDAASKAFRPQQRIGTHTRHRTYATIG